MERMSVKEFRERGYLQEANRQFFHPLGLALEVVIEEDGTERFGGVWDYRDDPEGIVFGTSEAGTRADKAAEDRVRAEKARRVMAEQEARSVTRRAALGYVVQPVGVE